MTRLIAVIAMWLPGLAQAGGSSVATQAEATVVFVVAADIDAGKLIPKKHGSGTIVHEDGTVLTNYHVIRDNKEARLHDLFLIGRPRSNAEPDLVCAGRPSNGTLRPDIDLATIRCDRDLAGKPLAPAGWSPATIGRSEDIHPGTNIWIAGFPDKQETRLKTSSGIAVGWAASPPLGERAFLQTEADVRPGDSGGAAFTEDGLLIGVATAIHQTKRLDTTKHRMTARRVGLVRPIEHAASLLEKRAPRGVRQTAIQGRIRSTDSAQAVADAVVMAFPEALSPDEVAPATAIAWGRTNETGEFTITPGLPPGRYGLAIWARGYRPLFQSDALSIDSATPRVFEPWPFLEVTPW